MIPKGTRILVTGGAGFIGSSLIEHLSRKGCRLKSLDIQNLPDDLRSVPSICHVQGDISRPEIIRVAVENAEIVFHLAGLVTQKKASEKDYHRINVDATARLLKECVKAKVKKFIYCSTDSVSGRIPNPPAKESDPCYPDNIYGITKLAAEKEVLRLADQIDVVIIRPTRTYGPRDVRMLDIFKKIRAGRFFIVGKGDVLFHPVFIDDLIHGFECCMIQPVESGEIFYIGGESPVMLKIFLESIADHLKVKLPWIRIPLMPAKIIAYLIEKISSMLGVEPFVTSRNLEFFTRDRVYDISKAKRMLQYQPRVMPSEGIRRTGDWYKEKGYL